MRPPIIAGNWKMNGLLKDARDLATGLRKELGDNAGGPEVLVCPPFLALDAVLLGHSERRHVMGETNEMINKKVKACLAAGLLPVVCIGELLEERNMGVT